MQSRSSQVTTLNDDLNDLKKVFDFIEGYDFNKNVSLPSLKSLCAWLCIYALTEQADQEQAIDELIKKSRMSDFAERITGWIDKLSTTHHLKQIIKDYEASGGSFKIFVPSLNMKSIMIAKAEMVGLSDLLNERIEIITGQEENICIDMMNNLKFVWACDTNSFSNTRGQKIYGSTQFHSIGEHTFGPKQDMLPFVSANNQDHNIGYNLVTYSGRHYHVVTFKTKQTDPLNQEHNTETYLIEPVNERARNILQIHYYDILQYAHKEGIHYTGLIQNQQRIQGIPYLEVIETQTAEMSDLQYSFKVNVNFPVFDQPFNFVEARLGAFTTFKNKNISSSRINGMSYTNQRILQAHTVDTIDTSIEAFMSVPLSAPDQKYKLIEVTINYTASNPFMIVHQGIAESDYHPFWINQPVKGLDEISSEPQAYKALIATNSAALFSRPAMPGSSLSLAIENGVKKPAETDTASKCCACTMM